MNPTTESYLRETLHSYLNCKCKGNCILKSLKVENVRNGNAEIFAEPFDDAYDTERFEETLEKVERVLFRRRKQIFKSLGATSMTVTVCDEYSMQAAYELSTQDDYLNRLG